MFSNYAESTSSVVPEYSSLQHYYKNSQFGPKIPSTVPSMEYPTVQKLGNPWGYDALNHHSDGNEYYNVKNAYDSKCSPDFYVASCPTNRFVRPFPGTGAGENATQCPVETKPVVEGFEPTRMPTMPPLSPLAAQLKALQILFFFDSSGKCPHSLNALQAYKEQLSPAMLGQVLMLRDLATSSHHEKALTDLGGTAIPFYYSRVTHKSFTGMIPSLTHLLQNLQSKEHYRAMAASGAQPKPMSMENMPTRIPSASSSALRSVLEKLRLKIYVSRGCGYCDQMKRMFQQHDVYNTATWIDAHDPKHAMELKNVRGFPFYMSMTTGKSSMGYPGSFEKMVQAVQ